jgi:hypothetical protein
VSKVNALKDIKSTQGEKTQTTDSFEDMKKKAKDKSKTATESVPSQRFEHPASMAARALEEAEHVDDDDDE